MPMLPVLQSALVRTSKVSASCKAEELFTSLIPNSLVLHPIRRTCQCDSRKHVLLQRSCRRLVEKNHRILGCIPSTSWKLVRHFSIVGEV